MKRAQAAAVRGETDYEKGSNYFAFGSCVYDYLYGGFRSVCPLSISSTSILF
jgi:hypothetical protein